MLLRTFSAVNRLLADELDVEAGLPLERYEILLMLYQANGAMRPSELAENRQLSRSGATRLIDRLEGDGLVERRPCGGDGRGSVVALTTEGERRFREAGRIHLEGIERHVGAHLASDDMTELRRILVRLGTAIAGGMGNDNTRRSDPGRIRHGAQPGAATR